MIPTPREVTELNEKIDELEHDNSKLQDEIAELLFEWDTLNDRINRLDAQIRDWEGIAQTQSESIAYLRDQSETHRVAAVNWEQRAKDAEEERDAARDNYSSYREDLSEARKRIQEIEEAYELRTDAGLHWAKLGAVRGVQIASLREFFQIREDFSDAAAVQEIINQYCELRSLYETQSEELAQWSDSSQDDEETFYLEVGRGDAAEERASAWWEVAKQLVRVRDVWVGTADMWQSVAASRNSELTELKKALRVLGDGER